jgi:hypothetical protein
VGAPSCFGATPSAIALAVAKVIETRKGNLTENQRVFGVKMMSGPRQVFVSCQLAERLDVRTPIGQ